MTVAERRPTFTAGEVARLLNVSRDAIRKAEQEGRVRPARREAGTDDRYYYAEDIDALREYFRR